MLKQIGKKLICTVIVLCLMLGGIMTYAADEYTDEGAGFGVLNIDDYEPWDD